VKFVAKSKRSFAFSVDSFEIALDHFYTRDFSLPETLTVESLIGDFEEALKDLKNHCICTQHPEEIRRGIFRYCYELAKLRRPKTSEDSEKMEKVFMDAFLAESHYMNFEDVLSKFTLKHASNADQFLLELHSILSRRCTTQEQAKPFLDIIENFQKRRFT